MSNNDKEFETICPVCEKHHFEDVNAFDFCPLCGWCDDLVQRTEPDYDKGYNSISLNQAKKNYKETGKAFKE